MLLRGMHDGGCDDIYIIVTDLKKQEMDDVTAYFQLVTSYTVSRKQKERIRRQIQIERAFLSPPFRKMPTENIWKFGYQMCA